MYVCVKALMHLVFDIFDHISVPISHNLSRSVSLRTNKCFPIDMYGSGQNFDEIKSHARAHNLPVCRLHTYIHTYIYTYIREYEPTYKYIHTYRLISSVPRIMHY